MASNSPVEEPHHVFDTILTLDFGYASLRPRRMNHWLTPSRSQYSHLITRRLRELQIYSEMLPCTQRLDDLNWAPKGIIFSGGPYSVYDNDAPHVDRAFLELGVPILGICYGLQEIAWQTSQDNVVAGSEREYGRAGIKAQRYGGHVDRLFEGLEDEMNVWMSHGDRLSELPSGFHVIATTSNSPYAGIAHQSKHMYGIQFHPEVTHTPRGIKLLENFAAGICGAKQEWTIEDFMAQEIARIRALVGEKNQVLGAVSGGVDSTVAATLMKEAIGDRFHAVLVDNGVMRMNECAIVKEALEGQLGINLTVADAADQFLAGLKGVTDPEKKRKLVGAKFIDIFEEHAKKIEADAGANAGLVRFFLQGTLYPDVIESISFKGPSATIKTHHNVGGLPKRMTEGQGLKLIEPLRELFKDEVRELGRKLGVSYELVMRHPFPGPGIAIRILGEVTPERVEIARKADHIFISMIKEADLYDQISQAFAALDPSRAVGVMGDNRVYQYIIILRAVQTTDFMTAKAFPFPFEFLDKVSTRIINEVDGVCRVVYDCSSKPPGTIELE